QVVANSVCGCISVSVVSVSVRFFLTQFFSSTLILFSIFLRNCSNCRIICASQQFRARDCKNLHLFLHCLTKPTIEACESILVACYSFFYSQLSDQFKLAGLTVFNNSWSQVYDFGGDEGVESWSLLDHDVQPEDVFECLLNIKEPEISLDTVLSVVPRTLGVRTDPSIETGLVIFFPDGNREKRAKAFIREMAEKSCSLVATKEFMMKEVEASQVFRTDSYNSVVGRGPVIAIQHFGPDCIRKSHQAAKTIALETGSTGLVYVSSNPESAFEQISLIFNSTDLPQEKFTTPTKAPDEQSS
ncbi:protein XRP2-like, partial [Panonychus citri]|uniref:protein XRP2-like n=1 Tax=Panonychus citri TaxID=50023 RepID=UPI002307F0AD